MAGRGDGMSSSEGHANTSYYYQASSADSSRKNLHSASKDPHNESFYRRRVNHEANDATIGAPVAQRRHSSNFMGKSVDTNASIGIEIPHSLVRIDPKAIAAKAKALPIGELDIRSRPSVMMTVFMLPFPFICLGCCLSSSVDVEFNEVDRTVTIDTWPGYLCFWPFRQAKYVIHYEEVSGICICPSLVRINDEPAYYPVIVTNDGKIHYIGDAELAEDLAPKVLGYHQFFFGHQLVGYEAPDINEVIIEEGTEEGEADMMLQEFPHDTS